MSSCVIVLYCFLLGGISQAFRAPLPPSSSHIPRPTRSGLLSTTNGNEPINGDEPVNGEPPYKRTVNERTGYSSDSGYSQFLTRREQRDRKRQQLQQEQNEDGYGLDNQKSLFKKMLQSPKKALFQRRQEPGTLILVRHGESTWNRNQTFTGW